MTDETDEIRQLLQQILERRDGDDERLRGQLDKLIADVAALREDVNRLQTRDEATSESRAVVTQLRDQVTRLQTQMQVGTFVAATVLVAVIGLVFKAFGGAA